MVEKTTVMQRQIAVSAYMKIKQLLLLVITGR